MCCSDPLNSHAESRRSLRARKRPYLTPAYQKPVCFIAIDLVVEEGGLTPPAIGRDAGVG